MSAILRKFVEGILSFKTLIALFATCSHFTQTSRASSKMRIERDSSTNTVTFFPAEGSHSATVILMHGLGDSADGMSHLANTWAKQMPYTKFILPTADVRRVTLTGGSSMTAWYDIVGKADRASESCEGIEASVYRIRELLNHERSLGLPYSRMMLAGFSQGGAMSLFTGLQLPHDPAEGTLAGLVVMSGFLPGAPKFELSEGMEHLPVFHVHGDADPMVKPEWARITEQGLKAKGMRDYTLKMYRNVKHTISKEMLADCTAFMLAHLPDDPSFTVRPRSPVDVTSSEL